MKKNIIDDWLDKNGTKEMEQRVNRESLEIEFYNKIFNEDCLETMKRMPDNFIDLTVTSPPYDNLREYNGYSFDFESVARELFRVTKQGGVVVWVVGDATINGSETGTSFRQALFFKEIGFNLHDTMIYNKNNFAYPPVNRYFQTFEYMFVLSKQIPKTFNPIKVNTKYKNKEIGFKNSTTRLKNGKTTKNKYLSFKSKRIKENVWMYSGGYGKSSLDKISFDHPATFPEKLARDHIYSWSNEGDLVYDPFMGSGTTAKMAHLLKRNWIGSEISEEYVEIANKRLDIYLRQTSLF